MAAECIGFGLYTTFFAVWQEKSGELSSEGKKTIKLTSRKTVRLTDEE